MDNKIEEDLNEYLCLDCCRTFKAKTNKLPPECPYCDSVIVEEMFKEK